jgi:hypothetical protein
VYLWKDFRIDHVDVAINMFPSLDLPHISNTKEFELKILKLFNDLAISHIMGIMIVLSGLSYSNEIVKFHYPDIN